VEDSPGSCTSTAHFRPYWHVSGCGSRFLLVPFLRLHV